MYLGEVLARRGAGGRRVKGKRIRGKGVRGEKERAKVSGTFNGAGRGARGGLARGPFGRSVAITCTLFEEGTAEQGEWACSAC